MAKDLKIKDANGDNIEYYGITNIILNEVSGETLDIKLPLEDFELPSELTAPSNIFIFKVNDYKYLLSNDSDNIGVFLLDITKKTCNKIYNNGTSWSHFFKTDNNKVLITSKTASNGTQGVLIFDIATNNIKVGIDIGSGWSAFQSTENGVIIGNGYYSNSKGVLFYDYNTDEITQPITSGYQFYGFNLLKNGNWLIGCSNSASGLIYYKTSTNAFDRIYPNGSYWQIFENTPSGDCLICSTYSNQYMLLFNSANEQITEFQDIGYRRDFKIFMWNKNGKCFMSPSSSYKGFLMFDNNTKQIVETQYSSPYDYRRDKLIEFNNGDCIFATAGSTTSSNCPTVLYKNSTNEFITLYKSLIVGCLFISDNTILATCASSSDKNLFLYTEGDSEFTIISSNYHITIPTNKYGKKLGNGNYVLGFQPELLEDRLYGVGYPKGLYVYKTQTKEVIQLNSSNSFVYIIVSGNNFLASTADVNSLSGCWLYKDSDDSFTNISPVSYTAFKYYFTLSNGNILVGPDGNLPSNYNKFYVFDAANLTLQMVTDITFVGSASTSGSSGATFKYLKSFDIDNFCIMYGGKKSSVSNIIEGSGVGIYNGNTNSIVEYTMYYGETYIYDSCNKISDNEYIFYSKDQSRNKMKLKFDNSTKTLSIYGIMT